MINRDVIQAAGVAIRNDVSYQRVVSDPAPALGVAIRRAGYVPVSGEVTFVVGQETYIGQAARQDFTTIKNDLFFVWHPETGIVRIEGQRPRTNRMGDLSQWNGTGHDWAVVRTQVDCVYHKATDGFVGDDGRMWVDPRVVRHTQEMTQNGVVYGLYHYLHPDSTAGLQALFCWDKTHNLGAELRLALDVEHDGLIAADVIAFIEQWYALAGYVPIIYTRASYWDSLPGEDEKRLITADPNQLWWLAHYDGDPDNAPLLPRNVEMAHIDQYTDEADVPGMTDRNVDMNRLNVDVDRLRIPNRTNEGTGEVGK